MLVCRHCRRGYLTLVRTTVEHAQGTTQLNVVRCDRCGMRADHRDADDYYQERSVKGPNLFEAPLDKP